MQFDEHGWVSSMLCLASLYVTMMTANRELRPPENKFQAELPGANFLVCSVFLASQSPCPGDCTQLKQTQSAQLNLRVYTLPGRGFKFLN